jgi:PAS domain S-box-containing protein
VTLVRDDNQQPLYWIGVIEDITERRRMEAAVHESESQLRLITNSIPALVSYVSADQRYRFNNRAYEEWFGQSAEEVQGKMLEEVLGAEAMEGLRPYVERALSGETVRFESSIPYKDAGLRHISAAYVPDIGPDGKVRGFFALVSDISERRAMEMALLESEQQFRKVANSAPVMLWMTDETAQGTFLNASWLEYTGQTLEEGLGTGRLNAIHPEDRPIVDEVFSRAFAEREPFSLE